MNIYCARVMHAERGALLSWHTSKAKAQAAISEARRALGRDQIYEASVEHHEIGAGKAALCKWLSQRFDTDNG